jgi:hypothetical protein
MTQKEYTIKDTILYLLLKLDECLGSEVISAGCKTDAADALGISKLHEEVEKAIKQLEETP